MIVKHILRLSTKITLTTVTNKYIGKSTFRIGLGYTEFATKEINNDILLDQTYFNVSFYNTEYHNFESGVFERVLNPITVGYCNDTFLKFIKPALNDRLSLGTHLCPIGEDYFLVGDLNSRIFRHIEIFVVPCTNDTVAGVTWKPQEEIERVITSGFINTAITRSYFDFDDYDAPVKTFLSEADNHFLVPNLTTWIEYFVQENTALTSDNILFSEPFTESKFYDIAAQNVKTINNVVTGGAVLFISVGPHAETIQFERTIYSLMDLFGYLGGLFDFMFFVGFWFINGIQDKIYQNLISSNMYQIKSFNDNDVFDENSSFSLMEEAKNSFSRKITQETRASIKKRSNRIHPCFNPKNDEVSRANNISKNEPFDNF